MCYKMQSADSQFVKIKKSTNYDTNGCKNHVNGGQYFNIKCAKTI